MRKHYTLCGKSRQKMKITLFLEAYQNANSWKTGEMES